VAAGFRGPLFLLGLSATVVATSAGFRGPLPVPNLGASPVTTQAGFRGPLPIPNLGASPVTTQAGFRGPLPIPFLGAGLPVVEYDPEGGPSDGDYLLHEDDEVIMLVARAFLTMVN
jgi:hypothetical protein